MPQRNVRVDIPIGTPDEMNQLAGRIIERHIELGPASPLDDPIVNITALPSQKTEQFDRREEAFQQHAEGESLALQGNTALGTAPGQTGDTEGTVYFHVISVRSRLLQVHKRDEEMLSRYGFNVVLDKTKGRKSISAEIPIGSPEAMIKLVNRILEEHNDLGPASPLDVPEVDMVDLEAKHTLHVEKRNQAKKAHDKAESNTLKANTALGSARHQNVQTEGTMYNIITAVRDKLLAVHRNMEEELSTYGFNVVITSSSLPGEEGTTITGTVNAGETVGIYDEVSDSSNFTLSNTGSTVLIFCRSASEGSPCDPVVGITLNPGEDTSATGLELGASGNWLNITNTDPAQAGEFSVVVDS